MNQVSEETGFPIRSIYKARLYYTLEDGQVRFDKAKAPHGFKVLKAVMVCFSLFFSLKIASQLMLLVNQIDPITPMIGLFVIAVVNYFFWDWFTSQENIAIRLGQKQVDFRGANILKTAAKNKRPSRFSLFRQRVRGVL